jgi:hypothetical protein
MKGVDFLDYALHPELYEMVVGLNLELDPAILLLKALQYVRKYHLIHSLIAR